jgi:hypothetical protein
MLLTRIVIQNDIYKKYYLANKVWVKEQKISKT